MEALSTYAIIDLPCCGKHKILTSGKRTAHEKVTIYPSVTKDNGVMLTTETSLFIHSFMIFHYISPVKQQANASR
ncbi:unnamed protein product [Fasciola hepatica]|uniref:Uncharacterized protein n=1 Tax=Fasciola hepatica TaxID=6192 RepID=A0ABC9HHL6_FASHE